MAELTLERIAKIRADIYQNASDESYWDARAELLDAAERGLTQDRKAAAFDRLAEAMKRCDWEVRTLHDCIEVSTYCERYQAPTLLEAIEALPTNGEPKHGT